MRISRNQFIVTAAAVGCVFFLWYYLQLPLAFVISIVVSIILIALALKYKSSLVRGLCVFLIAAHMVRLALYLVPVYDKQPDVRLRYRSAPSALFSIPGSEGSMQLSIEEKGEMYVIAPPLLTKGVAVFNGTHILSQ